VRCRLTRAGEPVGQPAPPVGRAVIARSARAGGATAAAPSPSPPGGPAVRASARGWPGRHCRTRRARGVLAPLGSGRRGGRGRTPPYRSRPHDPARRDRLLRGGPDRPGRRRWPGPPARAGSPRTP